MTDKERQEVDAVIAEELLKYLGESEVVAYASVIADRLDKLGYCKFDAYALTFIDQLSIGLEDFIKDLEKIIRMIGFFELTEDKCSNILKFIKKAKERSV